MFVGVYVCMGFAILRPYKQYQHFDIRFDANLIPRQIIILCGINFHY